MLSYTEENYLKNIYHLSEGGQRAVLTNEISSVLNTKAATVTDMIKKLSAKALVSHEKYYGVSVTKKGKTIALGIVRKHRLWETFLVETLGFQWDEVHEVAEQLEHIQSPLLIEKLDAFLNFPTTDPHGHPIPDKTGKFVIEKQQSLSEAEPTQLYKVTAVKNGSPSFLQYLNKIGVHIGASVCVLEKIEFDNSLEVIIENKKPQLVSNEASVNILIRKLHL